MLKHFFYYMYSCHVMFFSFLANKKSKFFLDFYCPKATEQKARKLQDEKDGIRFLIFFRI